MIHHCEISNFPKVMMPKMLIWVKSRILRKLIFWIAIFFR